MRSASTILSTVALLAGFIQAPFIHIHLTVAEHAAAAISHLHAHVSQEHSGPLIGAHTADEDAIDVEWRIAAARAFDLSWDLAVIETAIVQPLMRSSEAAPPPQPRGHDPPDFNPRSPRSPPA